MPNIPSIPEVDLDFDFAADALRRLWAAYELAKDRTARYVAEGHTNVEGAQFHEMLLEHLAFGNESGVVQVLHSDGDGVVVHVTLWEDE